MDKVWPFWDIDSARPSHELNPRLFKPLDDEYQPRLSKKDTPINVETNINQKNDLDGEPPPTSAV